MAVKKSNYLIKLSARIFTGIVCAGFLFFSIIQFILFSQDSYTALNRAFSSLFAAILFVPVYGFFLSLLSEGVAHLAKYVRGTIFVLRTCVLIVVAFLLISDPEDLKTDLTSVFRLYASDSEIAELMGYLESENWYEFELNLDAMKEQDLNINYTPLIARNFELAIEQVRNDPPSDSPETLTSLLDGRLSYLSSLDTLQSSISDYENSSLHEYIPADDMISLLIAYGKFYLNFEYLIEAEEFFAMAMAVSPDNPDAVLQYADAIYSSNYLQDAALLYQKYMILMGNEGRDRDIPARIRKFVRSENYGEGLQRKLFECWLTDAWNEIPSAYWDSYENREDYLRIGNRFYTSIWGGGHLVYELADCAGKIMGRNIEGEDQDLSPLKDLSGIEVTDNTGLPFTDVNPEIVEWCRKNLIPDPDFRLLDQACSRFYDIILQRSCRQKALGYAFLNTLLDVDKEVSEYEKLLFDEDFIGYKHLWRIIREPSDNVLRQDAAYWILQEETGFWLRRRIDGSYEECWKTLEEILINYDADWYALLWGGWIQHDNFDPGSEEDTEEESY